MTTDNQQPSSQKFLICCFWVFLGISMIGCDSSGSHRQENAMGPSTSMSQTPNFIEFTETPPITNTPKTTSTFVVSPNSQPLSPTSTTASAPTLTFTEGELLLQELMITNGDCQLPCWWGVNIGDSLESAGQKFNDLGMRGWNVRTSDLGDEGLMGSITTGYYDTVARLLYLGISPKFHTTNDNDNIQFIRMSVSRPSFVRGEPEFVRDWQPYFLSSMLQNYGRPSQVYLRIRSVADVTPTPVYSISLFYPEKGISITYNLEGKWLDDDQLDAEFCLDMKNVNPVEIALFNPNNFEQWTEYFPPYDDELYVQSTWEAQIGMDLETFYQTYQDPNDLGCVQVIN